MPRRAVFFLLTALAAIAIGCDGPAPISGDGAPTAIHPARLEGTGWTIVAAQGRPLPMGDDAIWFDRTIVFGTTGCNAFSTRVAYEPAGGVVRFERAVRMTKKACPGAQGVFEQSFLQALVGATTASLDPQGRLVLDGAGGAILLAPTDRPRPTD